MARLPLRPLATIGGRLTGLAFTIESNWKALVDWSTQFVTLVPSLVFTPASARKWTNRLPVVTAGRLTSGRSRIATDVLVAVAPVPKRETTQRYVPTSERFTGERVRFALVALGRLTPFFCHW